MSSLIANHLTFGFNGRDLLSDLSITLARPGLTLLVGPNGSGKSTLLRLLAGLLSPESGNVSLGERSLRELGAHERALQIAWLSQNASHIPSWPVAEYIMSGRYPHGDRPIDRVNTLLAQFEIEHLQHQKVDSLSSGERQLVRIARALIQETPFLLLDEPFGPLDLRHRARLLEELKKKTRVCISVTHDFHFVEDDVEEVLLFCEGKVVEQGRPSEVLTPHHIQRTFGI